MPGTPKRFDTTGQPFHAVWPGRCAGCGSSFEAGTLIEPDDSGGYTVDDCAGCKEAIAQLTPKHPPCANCFQIPAANGTCGCDA